jgi:hypothetical protein
MDPGKIVTKYLTLNEILKSIPGIPYYNDVVGDRDKKDFTWGVTKRVIQYAKELIIRPDSYKNWPPIIVLDGKLQDGAHRISTMYLMQQRIQPNNPIWKTAKLKVEFGSANNVKQGVLEGEVIKPDFSKRFKPTIGSTETKSPYYKNPDIDVPAFDKRRKSVWRDGVSNPKDREEFHHFEVDSSGRSYQITGITKSGERIQISTTPLKELAEVLANAYNRGGFTDVDIERVPLK